jgi:pyruvate,water dikinase
MDVTNATQRLHTGQWVRLNGETGIVEVLDPSTQRPLVLEPSPE